jgi:hypothetical protein
VRKSLLVSSAVTAIIALPTTAAFGQASRTWVSGTGDDANSCSRTAPCKTFAGAISKTAPNGEIDVLDPGGFGAVTIVKPITIKAEGALGGILNAGTAGINITITDFTNGGAVVLDGLSLDGFVSGTYGIHVLSATDVTVRNCTIRGDKFAGIFVDGGATSTSSVRVVVDNTQITRSTIGIKVAGTPGLSHAKIFNSLINTNATAGIQVIGAGNDVVIARNEVIGSLKSLDLQTGGVAKSYGNNVLSAGDAPISAGTLQ